MNKYTRREVVIKIYIVKVQHWEGQEKMKSIFYRNLKNYKILKNLVCILLWGIRREKEPRKELHYFFEVQKLGGNKATESLWINVKGMNDKRG